MSRKRKNRKKYYNKKFITICQYTQEQLKTILFQKLLYYYNKDNIYQGDGYIYARGNIPVLITSHMDTVHEQIPTDINEWINNGKHYVSALQGIGGDDRCGIYSILKILEHYKNINEQPSILFCEDEEIGGIGSGKFIKTEHIKEFNILNKFLIEIDRHGCNDAVYYDCGNEDFKKFIYDTIGYTKDYGTFSDICNLSPCCDLASVNLSSGYYKEHKKDEYVCYEEMENTINAVIKLIDRAKETDVPMYDYQEIQHIYDYWGSYYGLDDYDYYIPRNINQSDDFNELITYVFEYKNSYTDQYTSDTVQGYSFDNCLLTFFYRHGNVCMNDIEVYYEIKSTEDYI